MPPGRELLIFDLDGTLFHTAPVTVTAVQQTFLKYNLQPPGAQDVTAFFGRPNTEFDAWVTGFSKDGQGAEVLAAIRRRELELVSEVGQLYPGVTEVLATLRASGCSLALCSNGDDPYVSRVLETQRLGPLFDAVRYRGKTGRTKPQMVGDLLADLVPQHAIVLGDRREDVDAAHLNGLMAIGASYGYGLPDELREADAIAQAPIDLPRLVNQLIGHL